MLCPRPLWRWRDGLAGVEFLVWRAELAGVAELSAERSPLVQIRTVAGERARQFGVSISKGTGCEGLHSSSQTQALVFLSPRRDIRSMKGNI